MRIISWNINGLKTRFNDLKKLIEDYSPDVVCLQKVRCSCERDTYQIKGYKILYSSADFGNWSGVMMYVKIPSESKANSVWEALPKPIFVPRELSKEGHLQAYHCNNFALINAYVPYANPNIENAEYYRVDWDYKFKEYIHDLSSLIPVIICGDFNIVHTEKDTCEPKLEINRPYFSKPERRRFDILLSECKLVDAFRSLNPNDTTPTFYGNFRHLQIGNRLDYFLVSNRIKDKILSCKILKNFSEGQSDPIMLEIANGPFEAKPKNKPFIFYNTMIDNSVNNESDNSPVITDDL